MSEEKQMTNKPEWEELEDDVRNSSVNRMRTWRMRVSGGYIYRMMDKNENTHAMFVPDVNNE